MGSKIKKLLISLMLGIGIMLGVLIILAWDSQLTYAAGPRYVAPSPLGGDSGNDCLSSLTPCATVQYAVDQADPDDEIRVAAGTYTGVFTRVSVMFTTIVTQAVYISKPLTIRGGYSTTDWNVSKPMANPTIVDAQGQGRVFNIENTTTFTEISVTLAGFYITNGNATGQVDCWGGRGAGGGISGCAVTATLMSNYIYNNSGSHAGGGVALIGAAPLILIDNRITTNTVAAYDNIAAGGGVALGVVDPQQNALLEANLIRDNRAIADGPGQSARGGGFFEIGNAVINGNLIQANEARALNGAQARGGGVDFEALLTMTNTVIADNRITGPGNGAGLFLLGQANFWHVTVARNGGGDGSGLHLLTNTLTMTNSMVISHTIGLTVSQGSTATLNSVLWFNNSTANITGAGKIDLTSQFTGDPAFSTDGYHLGPGSAAFDRGINAGVLTDIDGETRSLAAPDLGADEGSASTLFLPLILKN